jgi:hypothetical protein
MIIFKTFENIYKMNIDLRTFHKANSQLWLIADFFENNIGKIIPQKQISYEYSKKWFEKTGNQVGDVQRQIRNFFGKHKLHGLNYIGKGIYHYDPISKQNLITENNLNPRNFSFFVQKEAQLRSKKKCELCGTNINKNEEYDHWIPYSYGGKSVLENCVVLCRNCNLKKKDKNEFNIILKFIKNINKINKHMIFNTEYNMKKIDTVNIIFYYLFEYVWSITENKEEWFYKNIIQPESEIYQYK